MASTHRGHCVTQVLTVRQVEGARRRTGKFGIPSESTIDASIINTLANIWLALADSGTAGARCLGDAGHAWVASVCSTGCCGGR